MTNKLRSPKHCLLTDAQLNLIAEALDHYQRYEQDLAEDLQHDWTHPNFELLSAVCRDVAKEQDDDGEMTYGLCL